MADRSCRYRRGDFVIAAPTPEVDDIGVVRILEDAQEIPLAQTLAVAPEQFARGGPNLTGARRRATSGGVNRAANEIEGILPGEPEPAGSDAITIQRWCRRW